MLGVPTDDRLLLRDWANAILTALEPSITAAQLKNGNHAVEELRLICAICWPIVALIRPLRQDHEVLQILCRCRSRW